MILIGVRHVCCLLLLCAGVAQGQIVLTNYTTASPLKITPIGDSITDDCSANGAWRLPLQPLLQTNGFPFRFLGRQQSAAVAGFTQTSHEGYCGAVVASPGVFAAHQYTAANNYLQKIVPDALASAKPDVMLILIGANDMGLGRNPYVVATNNMSVLLDLIFSNAPNVQVILNKALTIQNGNVNGTLYGNFATNVPIYNAMLQQVVNQRRALGQKVFLADMYSALSSAADFNSDNVHPNSLGLKAIAQEWLTRIQAITVRTNLVTTVLVNGGASWNYNDTGQDLGTNWVQNNYDDSAWSNGIACLGYGDPAVATTVNYGPQPTNKFPTTYFRRPFVVPPNVLITNLNFRLARGDGAVAYLNGQEIFRTNVPAGPVAYTNLALSAMTVFTRSIFYPTNVLVGLTGGTNYLAVEVHVSSTNAPAMGFDMELIGTGYLLPPPTLSIGNAGGSGVTLNWPLAYVNNFSLYSTTNPAAAGSWNPVTGFLQTNNGQIITTQTLDSVARFFRLQQP